MKLNYWVIILTALFMAEVHAEDIANFQEDSIVILVKLSKAGHSRTLFSEAYSPSKQMDSNIAGHGNIVHGLSFGYVACDSKIFSGKTLESSELKTVNSRDGRNIEIAFKLTLPVVPTEWLKQQEKYVGSGGCGYFEEPKIIALEAKGSVPVSTKNRKDNYRFSEETEGYELSVEVTPLVK